ncbi:MAG: PIG-L family deacetylase [Alphaproteobacteria bacterium]|nr:MAG: PIG-L family deacetylase [Alphaproteobacteria bacterium]
MRICIVSPHLDDAILSCGILMQRRIASGDAVLSLNIFSSGTNSQNRKKEDQCAQGEIGAGAFFLDELDAPDRDPQYNSLVKLFFGALDKSHDPYIDKVAGRIEEFLKHNKIDMAWFPLAAGTHIDHRIAYEAGRRIKSVPVRFYEDRPYILWPGVLQGRMNQIGSDAALPRVTEKMMRDTLHSYHYLKHFVPEGSYQKETLPLYFTAATQGSSKALRAKVESLTATEKELEKLYRSLAMYDSQMPLIYSGYDNFISDSYAHEKAMSGQTAYIERAWTLEPA